MTIRPTDDQWADVQHAAEVPVTEQERLFHLQQFGRRAGWDDPEMDVYDLLDPRRQP